MTQDQRADAIEQFMRMAERADLIADSLDPQRLAFVAGDKLNPEDFRVVKAADEIRRLANMQASILRVRP